MTDKFKRLAIDANKYDETQFDSAINILSDSLSGPQRHIFDWILVQLYKQSQFDKIRSEILERRILALEKEVTFKGVE